ncbi:MAG: VWA domain-containing protein [Verrucomicrobiae bacterium]|nr:VWA domain-containing protein [Verrucomicrobiae bacterium]
MATCAFIRRGWPWRGIMGAIVLGGALFCLAPVRGMEDSAKVLQSVVRAAREGYLAGLEPLKNIHDARAGDAVVRIIEDKKTPAAFKQRIAELVAQWPWKGGLDYFEFYLRTHPRLSDEMLRFYADLGCVRFKPFFLGLLAPLKTAPGSDIKEPARCATALRALGRFPEQTEAEVSRIIALLDEKFPHVIRISAAEALGGIKSRQGLPALIALVKDDTVGEAAQRSLYRLTGQDFGEEADKWNAWFKEHGQRAELKMLGVADWETHREKKPAAAPEKQEFSASFYGVKVKTRHCLFILDSSGSMEGERIRQLKEEMSNLLAGFQGKPKEMRFGIIIFHSTVETCLAGRGLLKNDPASIKKAARFVEGLQAFGATAMVGALHFALTKVLPGGDVDTIYLLSDGAPTDGPPEEVLAMAHKIHEDFRVRIHTIGIGEAVKPAESQDRQPTLLEQIANRTGGTYTTR